MMLAVNGLPVELVNRLAFELGDDLVIIASFRHGPDFSNERVGITDCLGAVRPPPNLDCFRRSTLPANLQVQQLWLFWILDDRDIADQQTDACRLRSQAEVVGCLP